MFMQKINLAQTLFYWILKKEKEKKKKTKMI